MIKQEWMEVDVRDVLPMTGNFRKRRDPEKFQALVESIREHGVLTPVWVVREEIEIGIAYGVEEPVWAGRRETKFRLIAGEGRYLAVKALHKEGVSIPLPVQVMVPRDGQEARVLTLLENLLREDLSLPDEVAAVAELLDGGMEAAVIARELGISPAWVSQRVSLSRAPVALMTALEAGRVTMKTALQVCALPDAAMRHEVTERVLDPTARLLPMNEQETRELIEGDYMLPLAGVPWDLAAEGVGGAMACVSCPHLRDRKRAGRACLSPACYRAKVAASWEQMVEKFPAEGFQVLPPADGEEIFEADGELPEDSIWIDLGAQVPANVLGHWGARTWGEFLAERIGAPVESVVLVYLVLHPKRLALRQIVDRSAVRMLMRRYPAEGAESAAGTPKEEARTEAPAEDLSDQTDGADLTDQEAAEPERAAVVAETMTPEEMEVFGGLFRRVVALDEENDPALDRPGFVRGLVVALLRRMRPAEVRRWGEVCGVPIDGEPVQTAIHHVRQMHPRLCGGLLAVACCIGNAHEASVVAEMIREEDGQ